LGGGQGCAEKKTIIIRDPYCYWTVSDEEHIFWGKKTQPRSPEEEVVEV